MGRRSIERVVVDRRVLVALAVAAIGFFCTDALNSPYQRPWNWGREDTSDLSRHQVANALPQATRVRASATMLPLLAERPAVYALSTAPDAHAAADGVNRVVVTDQDVQWDVDEWQQFRGGMSRELFVLTYDRDGVRVYTRLSSP
jgi:histone H3/H4